MNISAVNPYDAKWYKYLSEKRLEKLMKIKSPQKKAQSICAELLLRHAVGEITGDTKNVLWYADGGGKLFLAGYPDIHVNLSHSGDWAVCAVHDKPVGIDIEKFREYNAGLARRFFAGEEINYIESQSDKDSAFIKIWTRKESLLKAVGKGLTVKLNSFSVLADEILYGGVWYKFKEYRVRDSSYRLSVCFTLSGL